uniref:Reticulon n=2 Tax=Oncorhynchus kisutch TaxID=8019 RepID=A0A8C7L423_ONCKI
MCSVLADSPLTSVVHPERRGEREGKRQAEKGRVRQGTLQSHRRKVWLSPPSSTSVPAPHPTAGQHTACCLECPADTYIASLSWKTEKRKTETPSLRHSGKTRQEVNCLALPRTAELVLNARRLKMDAKWVVELLYWRDVKTSGVVFGASLSLLLSLTLCSIVSVSSYIGLALLSVTICFRIYKGILQAIQKSDEGHPFKLYLDQDVALSEGTVHKYSDCVLARFNTTVTELRRLFLVEDLVDSLKFAVLMWILTYVGALFNGLTLFILGLVGMFSCPIVYEKYKVQIDHYVGMASKQVKDIIATVQSKVPGLKRVKAE